MSELFTITHDEIECLRHLGPRCFMVYVGCLRPYVDYSTGLVGIKRRISLQQISEYLYEPSRPGVKEKKLTRMDCKRLLQRMHDCNMIEIVDSKKMILRLPKAIRPNEVDTDVDTEVLHHKPVKLQLVSSNKNDKKTEVETEVDTPIYNNKYNIIPSGGVTHSGDMCITFEDKMYDNDFFETKRTIPDDWQPSKQNIQLASDLKLCLTRQLKNFIDYNQTKQSKFDLTQWDDIFSSWLQRAQIFAERRRSGKGIVRRRTNKKFDYGSYLPPDKALSLALRPNADCCPIYIQSLELAGQKLGSVSKIRTCNYKTGLNLFTRAYQELILKERSNYEKT